MKKKIVYVGFLLLLFIVAMLSYEIYEYKEKKKIEKAEQEAIIEEEKRFERLKDDCFFVDKDGSEITFDETELKVQTLYFEMEYGKKYSTEDLKTAYFEKNDLFYEYMRDFSYWLYAPDEVEYALNRICRIEFGDEFKMISPELQDIAEDIYRKEQQLVTDYYGDSRIMLYKLTRDQQMELYNLFKDPSYVLDDKLMETTEPFTGHTKQTEKNLTVTKIEGNTITLEEDYYGGTTVTYIGTFQKTIDFEVGDVVNVEFYFYKYELHKYYDVQFEEIEKE